jgi:hypothetical protein
MTTIEQTKTTLEKYIKGKQTFEITKIAYYGEK